MNQQRIIFESSPALIILCVVAGLGYAYMLYSAKHPWPVNLNKGLFALRAALVFLLSFLLLGPIVKQINNLFEKPLYVVVNDNSASVKEATDSLVLRSIRTELKSLRETLADRGFEVRTSDLEGNETGDTIRYDETSSNIQETLKKISNLYEGRKISGVILTSDGIYNSGLSPLYTSYNFPIYTVGLGDTSQRMDLAIKNIAYNKIAYQGNRFPIKAEVLVKGMEQQDVTVSLLHRGRVLDKQTKNQGHNPLVVFDFQPSADEQGILKLDIAVEVKPEEFNARNNRSSVFVEVVEGKKKIMLAGNAPHPDIKALRSAIDKNSNYDFLLHIPGVSEQQASALRPDKIDLAIFYQSPDLHGRHRELFQQFVNSKTALFVMVGHQSDLAILARSNMPLRFDALPRDFDEVTPAASTAFPSFTLSAETNSRIASYPPVSVHFGRMQVPLSASPLLYQRVGSITTDKPLLAVDVLNERKVAIMLGEGFWRWKLHEFDRAEDSQAFDELFGKLIQFLSTTDDKKKFRSYPVQQEFPDTEPVIFESQVYNDIFEPVYGNTINIELTDENGRKMRYTYVTSPGNSRYQIGGLQEGVYKYTSITPIDGKAEQVSGQFAVIKQLVELQNLTADFGLLRKLAENTGGKFYTAASVQMLKEELGRAEASSTIRTEEAYDSVINLKWIFWILLTIIGVEWFLRKFYGSY